MCGCSTLLGEGDLEDKMRVGFPCPQEAPAHCRPHQQLLHAAHWWALAEHVGCRWMRAGDAAHDSYTKLRGGVVQLWHKGGRAVTCCFSFSSLKGIVKMSSTEFRPRTLATPCVDTLSTRCRLPVVGSPRKSTCRAAKTQRDVANPYSTMPPETAIRDLPRHHPRPRAPPFLHASRRSLAPPQLY